LHVVEFIYFYFLVQVGVQGRLPGISWGETSLTTPFTGCSGMLQCR